MADAADPSSWMETARTVIVGMAGIVGAVSLLSEKIRRLVRGRKKGNESSENPELLMSAENIVEKNGPLTTKERKKVLRVLRTRFWIAAILVVLMLLMGVVSVVAWAHAYPPRKTVTSVEMETSGPVNTAKDAWLKDASNPLLNSLFAELTMAGKQFGPRFRVVTIQTKPVAGPAERARSLASKVSVTYDGNFYRYGPPYVFLHHQVGDTYELLKTRLAVGRFDFDLPAAGAGDYVLVIGGLTNTVSDTFPERFDQVFNIKVVQ